MILLVSLSCPLTTIKFRVLGCSIRRTLLLMCVNVALICCEKLVHWLSDLSLLVMTALGISLVFRPTRSSRFNSLNLSIIILVCCQISKRFLISMSILLPYTLDNLLLLFLGWRQYSHATSCVLTKPERCLWLTLLVYITCMILATWPMSNTFPSFQAIMIAILYLFGLVICVHTMPIILFSFHITWVGVTWWAWVSLLMFKRRIPSILEELLWLSFDLTDILLIWNEHILVLQIVVVAISFRVISYLDLTSLGMLIYLIFVIISLHFRVNFAFNNSYVVTFELVSDMLDVVVWVI